MSIYREMTDFIESIPKENWFLNTTIQNGIPSFSISTKHNGITIDIRYKVGTRSAFCFRVYFLEGEHNHTTVMENFKSDIILEFYSRIIEKAEQSELTRIGNILFP